MKQKTHHNNHYRNYNHHHSCSHCVLLAVTVLILTLLCSCNTESIQIHYALKAAGSNRSELKSVLKHYRTADPDQEPRSVQRPFPAGDNPRICRQSVAGRRSGQGGRRHRPARPCGQAHGPAMVEDLGPGSVKGP